MDQIEALKKSNDISENEYYVIRTHRVDFNLLSENTKNDSNNFTHKTTRSILDEINKNHISLLKRDVEEEKIINELNKKRLEEKEGMLLKTNKKLEFSEKKFEKLSNIFTEIITWIILPFVLAIIIFSLSIDLLPVNFKNFKLQIFAFLVIIFVTIFGFDIFKFKNWLSKNIKSKLDNWIEKKI